MSLDMLIKYIIIYFIDHVDQVPDNICLWSYWFSTGNWESMSLIMLIKYLFINVPDHVYQVPDILCPWSCLSTWYSLSLIMFIYLRFYDLYHVYLPDILWSLPCWLPDILNPWSCWSSRWYSMDLIMLIWCLLSYVLNCVDLIPSMS